MFGCRFISALSGTAARSSVRTLARPPAYRPIGVRTASQRKASGIGILLRTDLLYDLIGAAKQRDRDGQAERLGGLEVDGEFHLGRLLDWQIGGLRTLEDARRVVAAELGGGHDVGAVAH